MNASRLRLLVEQTERKSVPARDAARALRADPGLLAELMDARPEDLATLRKKAHALLCAGHAEKARVLLEMLHLLHDDHPLLPLLWATCCHQLGDDRAAEELLVGAIDRCEGIGAMATICNDAQSDLQMIRARHTPEVTDGERR